MTLFYRLTADAVVLFHMAYAMTVALGLPVIWVGILFRRPWARNVWWRCGHLTMILVVVAETWAGIQCPLTTWEQQLRKLAQQETYSGDFIANLVHDWLFYNFSPAVFKTIYSVFGLLVFLSFVFAPPHWPQTQKRAADKS